MSLARRHFHAIGEEADGRTVHENTDELQRFVQRTRLAEAKGADSTALLRSRRALAVAGHVSKYTKRCNFLAVQHSPSKVLKNC